MSIRDWTTRHHWLLIIAALVVVALPLAWFTFQWAVEPGEPSDFYRVEAGTSIGAPGTVLRTQSLSSTKVGAPVWRVLGSTS